MCKVQENNTHAYWRRRIRNNTTKIQIYFKFLGERVESLDFLSGNETETGKYLTLSKLQEICWFDFWSESNKVVY